MLSARIPLHLAEDSVDYYSLNIYCQFTLDSLDNNIFLTDVDGHGLVINTLYERVLTRTYYCIVQKSEIHTIK